MYRRRFPRVTLTMHRSASRILGTGSYLPSRVVPNDEFAENLETSDEWIRSRTGIRERRYAAPGDTAATMGTLAAREALVAANLQPGDVDMVVCATVTPDLMCPSTACLIQSYLECGPVPAFDVTAACSGFVYALSVAEQYVRTGDAKNVLVVGAEVLSRVSDFTDRNTCILFGDGAGAVVVGPADGPGGRVHKIRLFADGGRQELIQVPSKVTPNPPPGSGVLPNLNYLRMNGREVFKFAVTKLKEMVTLAQADCEAAGKELKLIVPHQVNVRIIDAALEDMAFPPERVVVNLDKYGNTSAASVPIALDEGVRTGRCGPGDTILLVAFGGGLTWSSALVTL
jgi:3-oxoacyl-[acyl-carrier-protein] synthase III